MRLYRKHRHGDKRRLGLITPDNRLAEHVFKECRPIFRVERVYPEQITDILQRVPDGIADGAGASWDFGALLIDWTADLSIRLAALLASLEKREAKGGVPFPIIAICPPGRAESISALMVGADYTVRPPVRAPQVQAFRLAYVRQMSRTSVSRKGGDISSGASTREEKSETESWSSLSSSGGRPRGDGQPTAPLHVRPSSSITAGLRVGPLTINVKERKLWVRGSRTSITSRPFDVLAYLMQRHGECCHRDYMLREVWGIEFDPSTNVIDVQIYTLREMLEEHDLDPMIETVRGQGYRLQWPI